MKRFIQFMILNAAVLTLLGACGKTDGRKDDDDNVVDPGVTTPEADAFLEQYGRNLFSLHYQDALNTFVQAEGLCAAADYARCDETLKALWAKYPVATNVWGALQQSIAGTNTGSPSYYVALRMLSEIAAWHLINPAPEAPNTIVMTVLLVGKSEGVMPRTQAEWDANTGEKVANDLHPLVLADDYAVIRESLRLFLEHVSVISAGKLRVELKFVQLPEVKVPTRTAGKLSGMDYEKAYGIVWAATTQAQRNETDWWWIIYPSHAPDRLNDFGQAEFVTSGMGSGPDGFSPAFVSDDLWLVRRPSHMGKGEYSSLERRVYIPQWIQHEFSHYLYKAYPDFGLEKTAHSWHDRGTWPADFQGVFEADYFFESLNKRLIPSGEPALAVKLRYAAPTPAELIGLSNADVCGTYQRLPVENGFHQGVIKSAAEGTGLSWTNEAKVTWGLTPKLSEGVLETGADNPYLGSSPQASMFQLAFDRNADGRYLMKPTGFNFLGERYAKIDGAACGD